MTRLVTRSIMFSHPEREYVVLYSIYMYIYIASLFFWFVVRLLSSVSYTNNQLT